MGTALGPILKAVNPDLPWEVILMSVLSAVGGAGFIAKRDIETIRSSAFKDDPKAGK
tara:strand:- start:655 stop:825 length:171 start_codon:yes stop_codon:yes gene_type:complete